MPPVETASIVTEKPKSKRQDPNYTKITADMEKKVVLQLRINCLKKGLTIGEALTEAAKLWNEKVEGAE